ncbi:MAG TPA: hypothetical protein VEA99_13745 [Gemmatimonadaceae bacterium]|nr:hypothetical protein [Gemmatimonadaceae bacterium]
MADSVAFRAAARVLRDSAHALVRRAAPSEPSGDAEFALSMDPRPYILRPSEARSWPWTPDSVQLAEPLPGLIAARSRQLQALGIPRGDILALDACPGSIAEPEERLRCPRQGTFVAILSMPRASAGRTAVQAYMLFANAERKMGYSQTYYLRSNNGRVSFEEQSIGVIIE